MMMMMEPSPHAIFSSLNFLYLNIDLSNLFKLIILKFNLCMKSIFSITDKIRISPTVIRNLISDSTLEKWNHSEKLSNENSPTTFDGRSSRSDHRQTSSGPLIYTDGGRSSSMSSPMTMCFRRGRFAPQGCGPTQLGPFLALFAMLLGTLEPSG